MSSSEQRSGTRRVRFGVVALAGVMAAIALAACGAAGSHHAPARPAVRLTAARHADTVNAPTDLDTVYFLNTRVGWVQTHNWSRLLITVDGGRDWTNISPRLLSKPGGIIVGAFMLGRRDLWVTVSNDAQDRAEKVHVLHSTNGGRTWEQRASFPRDLGDAWISFTSRAHGWVMVDNGAAMGADAVTIYRTTDAGRRWRRIARSGPVTATRTPRGAPSLYCDKTGISFASASSGWIGGYCAVGAMLQRSRDGGRSWGQINVGGRNESGGFVDPPRFFTASDGVTTGGIGSSRGTRDAIYTTTDGGARWTLHEPPTSRYGGAASIVSRRTWFVFSGKTVFRTENRGRTWTSVRTSITPGDVDGDPLDFVNADDGWVITAGRRLWHTRDGGRTWSRL